MGGSQYLPLRRLTVEEIGLAQRELAARKIEGVLIGDTPLKVVIDGSGEDYNGRSASGLTSATEA